MTEASRRRVRVDDDVEPTSEESDNNNNEPDFLDDAAEYRRKKKMSARIFKCFIDADDVQQENLRINVDPEVQKHYRMKLTVDPRMKLHDLGDALMHALNDTLCGVSHYKQLIPSNLSLQCNRTVVVVVVVQPERTYWASLHVTWNKYELLDFDITSHH